MRWRGLDGLRAIAVLGVMSMHAGLPFFGGYGVQIFFVLSGFLITYLLRKEIDQSGTINYKNFIKRRLIRLFPALLLVISVVVIWSITFAPKPFGEASLWGAFYSLFYIGNWAQAFPEIFPWGWLGVLGQTWSLSVEMQFYLIWPFVIFLLHKFKARSTYISLGFVLIAILIATRRAMSFNQGTELSYLLNATDMNIDGLLLGSALGYSYLDVKQKFVTLSKWVGPLALIIILLIESNILSLLNDLFPVMKPYISTIFHPFYGGIFLIELLSVAIIFSITHYGQTNFSKILSIKPLVFIGSISYGLYLWHFPIFVGLETYPWFQTNSYSLVIKIALTFTCAICSYYLVEKPISRKFSSPRVIS